MATAMRTPNTIPTIAPELKPLLLGLSFKIKFMFFIKILYEGCVGHFFITGIVLKFGGLLGFGTMK